MIHSFSDKRLKHFWLQNRTFGIPPEIRNVLQRKLYILAMASTLEDLRIPPSNHLEALKGDWAGYYSIRVNRQWRLTFQWENNQAKNIALTDYH